MLKTLIIVTILALGSVTVFGQKVKPRKPQPKHYVVESTPNYACVENTGPKIISSKPISGGILNSKAISLPEPVYSEAARAARAVGVVNVQVLIDEDGNVAAASAASGHLLLKAAAVAAAREAKFFQTRLNGQPVKVQGILTYDFTAIRKAKTRTTTGDCFPGENRPFNGNVLNMKAISLPEPAYPAEARASKAGGSVAVRVQVDEAGNVVDACALSGNRLLRPAAMAAARNAKIKPVVLSGTAVKTSGLLVYNFTAPR